MGAPSLIGGQLTEYAELVHKGLTWTTSSYGSAFFLTTGFHGLHVTGGLIAFLFVLARTYIWREAFHPRAGHLGSSGLLLLALRRRRLDCPLRDDLPDQIAKNAQPCSPATVTHSE